MSEKCGKCGKTAYPTEQVKALAKVWHKSCFKCTTCGSSIQLGQELGHEGMPYCKRCHQTNFGIGGYGYGQGGTLSSAKYDHIQGGANNASTASTSAKFCKNCGNKLDGAFCTQCGTKN